MGFEPGQPDSKSHALTLYLADSLISSGQFMWEGGRKNGGKGGWVRGQQDKQLLDTEGDGEERVKDGTEFSCLDSWVYTG